MSRDIIVIRKKNDSILSKLSDGRKDRRESFHGTLSDERQAPDIKIKQILYLPCSNLREFMNSTTKTRSPLKNFCRNFRTHE